MYILRPRGFTQLLVHLRNKKNDLKSIYEYTILNTPKMFFAFLNTSKMWLFGLTAFTFAIKDMLHFGIMSCGLECRTATAIFLHLHNLDMDLSSEGNILQMIALHCSLNHTRDTAE